MRDRGALLGPEESGRESLVTRFLDRFFWVTKPHRSDLCGSGRDGGVAGAGCHQVLVAGCRKRGGFSLVCGESPAVAGGCGRCACPYFENCIVDASINLCSVV